MRCPLSVNGGKALLVMSVSAFDPERKSVLACPRPRRRGRHHHFLAALDAARTRPYDLASVVARHNVAAAFRADISSDGRRKVILRADIGADHVMKHRKNLQPFGAAGWAYRLIRFNLHRVALRVRSAASYSIKPEETNQHAGDAGGKLSVVHTNEDGRVQRRRRRVRIEADARDLGRGAVTR